MSVLQVPLVALWFGLGAGAWFAYFRLKERASSAPFSRNLIALLGGMISVVLTLFSYGQLDALNVTLEWSTLQGPIHSALLGALQIGVIEEGAKFLSLLMVLVLVRGVKKQSDAMLLALYVGIGFAAAEGMHLWTEGNIDLQQGLTRGLTAPLTHALFAAPMGLGLGAFLIKRQGWQLLLGTMISVASHGAYDLLLAQPDSMPAFSALVILALWTWLLLRWPYAQLDRKRELPIPYELAEAPTPSA